MELDSLLHPVDRRNVAIAHTFELCEHMSNLFMIRWVLLKYCQIFSFRIGIRNIVQYCSCIDSTNRFIVALWKPIANEFYQISSSLLFLLLNSLVLQPIPAVHRVTHVRCMQQRLLQLWLEWSIGDLPALQTNWQRRRKSFSSRDSIKICAVGELYPFKILQWVSTAMSPAHWQQTTSVACLWSWRVVWHSLNPNQPPSCTASTFQF